MKEIGSKIHGFVKALMMPISVIAAAGILLGAGGGDAKPRGDRRGFRPVEISAIDHWLHPSGGEYVVRQSAAVFRRHQRYLLYGFCERLLISTGLHHILNETVRFTPIGGMVTEDHQTLVGALTIFNTSLTHPGLLSDDVIRHATRFLAQGKIPTMMFGLPGAALAMYHCARPEHKERVKALMLAGGLASFTTGITEPLEFCFIFVSPVLYLFHAVLNGVAFMLMDMLHVMIGNVRGGAIDLVIFGMLGGAKTQWWYPVLLGAVYCPLYYGVFSAVIRRMNVETPGRESEEQTPPEQEKQSADERSQTIINGLGGRQNIADVDCCFTRLRVRDMQQVVDRTLMLTGASGVKRVSGNYVQVIYGPQVEKIAHDVKRTLGVSS